MAVRRLDAVSPSRDERGGRVADLHAVVSLERVIDAGHGESQIFDLQVVFGVNAVVV